MLKFRPRNPSEERRLILIWEGQDAFENTDLEEETSSRLRLSFVS